MKSSTLKPRSEIVEILADAFSGCLSMPPGTDWNIRELEAFIRLQRSLDGVLVGKLCSEDVYLGGDSLRPYLTARLDGDLWLISQCYDLRLSSPRLIADIDNGRVSAERIQVPLQNTFAALLDEGATKLSPIPNVYLASLTNLSKYQARRYPLNIGRLAQWLRFRHAGRVRVSDLALTFGGDLAALAAHVQSSNPDVLGISLNFGELNALKHLIASVRGSGAKPIICLGNVLAAWVAQEVEEICEGFQVFVSSSYGEYELEQVCLALMESAAEARDRKSIYVDSDRGKVSLGPEAIVMPDEGLLADTLGQRGQASIETSFGCQYGHCTFCPRDHRGRGWRRPTSEDAGAVVESISFVIKSLLSEGGGVLSIVDEDAFGEEGIDPECEEPSIVSLVKRAGSQSVSCEIYTRLEQIFHRGRSEPVSKRRMLHLQEMKPFLSRVFVGLESGSDTQLRRYGKGQTARDAVDALRAGSLLGLPLEFGFITFDPLLAQSELLENLAFLSRTDVILPMADSGVSVADIYSLVREGKVQIEGDAVFMRVAYLATELELFVNSPFLRLIRKDHGQLLGEYDSSFARFGFRYQDPVVERIAGWCRIWTEGTFKSIYKMRLASRAYKGHGNLFNPYQALIRAYRQATFGLLLSLTGRLSPPLMSSVRELSSGLASGMPIYLNGGDVRIDELVDLWKWVMAASPVSPLLEEVKFDRGHLERRRDA